MGKIKVSTFSSVLHDSHEFNENNKLFLESIENVLGDKLECSKIEDYDCDLKLIFIESGGSEGAFLKEFSLIKEPYYFLTSGENNSLAASLEILTYLNSRGLHGEIIHGDINYIAKRIHELCIVNKIKTSLNGMKLGVIGKPSDWLISSIPSYKLVKNKFGIDLIDFKIDEVKKRFDELGKIDIRDYPIKGKFDEIELEKAFKVYESLNGIVRDNDLKGITVRCFDLLSILNTTSCLSYSLFNDSKIIASCEGDIAALISMVIASLTGDGYTFQANPSRIDTKKNEIVFAHCTIPTKMLEKYKLDTHFESKIGVAIKGYLKKTDVTIFRISSNLKDYYVTEGKIIDNLEEENLCRTQIKVKLDSDVKELLKHPCGNHQIIFYGKHKDEIELIMKEIL